MSTSSTVPAIKSGLVAALAARPGLDGVQVARAHPGRAVRRETIYLGNVRGRHQIPVMRAGRKPRQETYALDLWIEVQKPGKGVEDAEDRAFELLVEVEDLLADDPKLAGSPILWATAGEFELVEGIVGDAGSAAIKLAIEVEARLT